MRRKLATLALVGALGLTSACANTVEGVEEDVEENVDEAQEGLDEAEQELEEE